MLSREAVAVALALAGVRTGASVLDAAPLAGLAAAARAAAGPSGRVDAVTVRAGAPAPFVRAVLPPGRVPAPTAPGNHARVRYSHLLAVRSQDDAEHAVAAVERHRDRLDSCARVVVGSRGSLATLVDRLRGRGWTVLHGATVLHADPALPACSELALAVARAPSS